MRLLWVEMSIDWLQKAQDTQTSMVSPRSGSPNATSPKTDGSIPIRLSYWPPWPRRQGAFTCVLAALSCHYTIPCALQRIGPWSINFQGDVWASLLHRVGTPMISLLHQRTMRNGTR